MHSINGTGFGPRVFISLIDSVRGFAGYEVLNDNVSVKKY